MFTTVVNIDDLVNVVSQIRGDMQGSGLTPKLENGFLLILGPGSGKTAAAALRIQRLYRPSAEDVEREASPDSLLVLTAPTQKAAKTATRYNHISLPSGGYRITAPGVALFKDVAAPKRPEHRRVRLRGLTGVVAETLLLERGKLWSVRTLAEASEVSVALAHRVLARLDNEGITNALKGERKLVNAQALAELWSQEDSKPEVIISGYLYGSSSEAIAMKLLDADSDAAIGGVLAANTYHPVLTRVNAPVRLWAPKTVDTAALHQIGLESADSGANVEIVSSKGNPWRIKMNDKEGFQRVSRWRAWVEIANIGGRTQELADEFIDKLLKTDGSL